MHPFNLFLSVADFRALIKHFSREYIEISSFRLGLNSQGDYYVFFRCLFVCLLLVSIGCDQDSSNIKNIVGAEPETPNTVEDADVEPEPVVAEEQPEPEPEPVVVEPEPEPEPEPLNNFVKANPSYKDLFDAKDNDAFQALLDKGTILRQGLIFPVNTFAVNEEKTILVAHTHEGDGHVRTGAAQFTAGGNIILGFLSLIKEGDVRILTHYDP